MHFWETTCVLWGDFHGCGVLHASVADWPVYGKCGFEVVELLDVDLRDWVSSAKGGDKEVWDLSISVYGEAATNRADASY